MSPPPQLSVRPAGVDELDSVMTLFQQRVEWLRSRGSDQWSTWEQWRNKIGPSLERGHVWLLLDKAEPIGTISVEFRGDRDFWTSDEREEPAAYLSKLAVRRDRAGAELGALLIDWASDYAYRRGCRYLRLDAWKTNDQLHAYYVDRGWTFLRTVPNRHRHSGALFQIAARPLRGTERRRIRDDFPVTVLQPTQGGPGITEPDPAGNWHPSHVHRGGMLIRYDVLQRPAPALLIDFVRYRLCNVAGEWQFDSVDGHFTNWRREGVVLEVDLHLNSGTTYIITHQEMEGDDCRMVVCEVPPELATTCAPVPPASSSIKDENDR